MLMNRTEITEKLMDILASAGDGNTAAIENCNDRTKLTTELGLTSVSMLFMVIAIEEEFGIRFDNVGVSDFVTVGDVVDYIERSLK